MAKAFPLPPLSDAAVARRQAAYNTTSDANLRLRAHMVLLAQQGRSVTEMAQIVVRSHDPVIRQLHAFGAGGLAALRPRKRPGPTPPITPQWEAELWRVSDRDPHPLDGPSAHWTTTLLAAYWARVTGITVSEETVRLRLHANGSVGKRSPWTLKRTAKAQAGSVGNA